MKLFPWFFRNHKKKTSDNVVRPFSSKKKKHTHTHNIIFREGFVQCKKMWYSWSLPKSWKLRTDRYEREPGVLGMPCQINNKSKLIWIRIIRFLCRVGQLVYLLLRHLKGAPSALSSHLLHLIYFHLGKGVFSGPIQIRHNMECVVGLIPYYKISN